MKNLLRLSLLVVVLGLVVWGCGNLDNPVEAPLSEQNRPVDHGASNAGPTTVTIWAGQHIAAGSITVWNDGDNLYVKYSTADDWCITETHLHVATSVEEIPQTDKGKFIPGHFDYQSEHDPCVRETTYVIPLEDEWVPCQTDLCIAAHAVVKLFDELGQQIQEETGWGNEWKGYFTHHVNGNGSQKIINLPTGLVKLYVYQYPHDECYVLVKLLEIDVLGGYNVYDGNWHAWCIRQDAEIPLHTLQYATLYSTYDPNLPPHCQDDDWDMVNYIINHKHPDATAEDIQAAIWYFVDDGAYPEDPEAQAMVDDALANGEGYRPGTGEWVAVICDMGENIQMLIIEVDP